MYPPSIWELEIAALAFFFVIQLLRLNFGYNANRTEHINSMVIFMGISLFSTLFVIYFTFLTTYVLLIEIIVGVIGIFFGILEIVLALIAVIGFAKSAR